MKNSVKVICHSSFKIGKLDPMFFGSFVEHLGRTVYSGIYEPDNSNSDEHGFRKDVLKAINDLGVSIVRYPGGNFVSCYNWENGIGEKKLRKPRLEYAWRTIESNEFGLNEFIDWCHLSSIEPMLTINLGTRGVEDAVNELEYCNHKSGTYYSDLRISHGYNDPHNVKYWCLGNEMDGPWQIGHKNANNYGDLAAQTAKAMKNVDPSIKLIVAGSSGPSMNTFPDWDATVLEHTYDYVDYISIHQYLAGQEKGLQFFLAQAELVDKYIKTIIGVCDFIKAKKRSDKTMMISFDEWNVFSKIPKEEEDYEKNNPWQQAPKFGEGIFTFQDTLLFCGFLLSIMNNADRVKISCQSLLVNVGAPIITQKGGGLFLQPIYYPFMHAANFAKGTVMKLHIDCPKYYVEGIGEVPFINAVCTWDEETGTLALFVLNIKDTELDFNITFEGMDNLELVEHIEFTSNDLMSTNSIDSQKLKPTLSNNSIFKNNNLETTLNALSWNVLRFKK